MRKVICAVAVVALTLILVIPGTTYARGHGHFSVGVHVGVPGYWWPGPWWWGPPYYPRHYYTAPPVIIEQAPVYVQPGPAVEAPQYWYYCQNPQGYYPYIKQCPQGWMKVVPPSAPPGQ